MDFSDIPFLPGLDLSQRFYEQVVSPLLARDYPELPHTACLIGYGSDVIGFDTPMSRDHMWGPRMILFLAEDGYAQNREKLDQILRFNLPHRFEGYPTSFGPPDPSGVRLPRTDSSGPVEHLIEIDTIPAYFDRELGAGRWRQPGIADWLTFSEHRLLSLTSGRVFHDDLGLDAVRSGLAYYPRDVWLYLLASEWSKISQEEPFVGRSGTVNDDLGSRVITARLVHACMRLGFLLERRYPPYSKWFGSAFSRLPIASRLLPYLQRALSAETWQQREAALCGAYETLAARQNADAIVSPVETRCSHFHDRPYQVIHAERIAAVLQSAISDETLKHLTLYGSTNQLSDSTDLLESTTALEKLSILYKELPFLQSNSRHHE